MSNSVETTFDKYSFTFYWIVNDLFECLRAGVVLKSPEFSSPDKKNPATFWKLEAFPTNDATAGVDSVEYMGIKLVLRSCYSNSEFWAKVTIYPQQYYYNGSQYVWSNLGGWGSQLQKLQCSNLESSNTISNDKFLNNLPGRSESRIRIQCNVDIYFLDKPSHSPNNGITTKSSKVLDVPGHNLGHSLDEARQKGLLTDVTLVTGTKEFKVHRVILAAQSPFFKARFEQRWEQSGDRVEMNDVSPEILEAVIKYMYRGEVLKSEDADFTCKLLSVADQYDLDKLRSTCEATLSKNISEDNVVDVLILADTHNGKDLKKLCIEYIVRNPSQVKKSSGWSKLESKESVGIEKLRMEVFEACFNYLL